MRPYREVGAKLVWWHLGHGFARAVVGCCIVFSAERWQRLVQAVLPTSSIEACPRRMIWKVVRSVELRNKHLPNQRLRNRHPIREIST